MKMLKSINPYTNTEIARYATFDLQKLDTVLADSDEAQKLWARRDFAQRAELMHKLAISLRDNSEDLAATATAEMGKTLQSSRAEIEKCAWACEHFANKGPAMLLDAPVSTDYENSYITYQPLGVVLAIMPWNFPYWQAFRFLAPALMAGNGVVLKHASNVSGCALAIEEILMEAGFPEGLFRTLLLGPADVPALITHPTIKAVTFTGSTHAGRSVAQCAGQALKKTVLELGGSDAYVVLKDADLELAVSTCVQSRLLNNGQSCIAAKRFIVHDSIYGDFAAAMSAGMQRKVLGDPMEERTEIGPLARPDLLQDLARQVDESVKLGAVLMCGGQAQGNFYLPTVLTEVRPGMPAFDEELFGPVAAVVRARSDEEAVQLANQSLFGLGAAVFSRNVAKAERIAREQLEAGCCFVNDFVKSDPRLPFGGIKQSGYGRELGAPGIREFTNIKTVVI